MLPHRPHQRDGVQFMFECVMGLRQKCGTGAFASIIHSWLHRSVWLALSDLVPDTLMSSCRVYLGGRYGAPTATHMIRLR